MSEQEMPMIGVVVGETGLVEAVVSNSTNLDGIPVVVIDQSANGLHEDELVTVNHLDGETEQALTYRVGGVFDTYFDMNGL